MLVEELTRALLESEVVSAMRMWRLRWSPCAPKEATVLAICSRDAPHQPGCSVVGWKAATYCEGDDGLAASDHDIACTEPM